MAGTLSFLDIWRSHVHDLSSFAPGPERRRARRAAPLRVQRRSVVETPHGGDHAMAQQKVALDAARFTTGLPWKDYMAQMGDTKARTEENYQKSALTDEERKFFGGVKNVKYVMMLAENWCGDVHRNSPLIAHVAEA